MEPGQIPSTYDELESGWLNTALKDSPYFRDSTIERIQVDPVGDGRGFTGQVVRVVFTYRAERDGAPRTAIVKFPNPIQERRTNLFNMFVREYLFYTEAAPQIQLRLPALYFAAVDPENETGILVLEDLTAPDASSVDLDPLNQASLALEALGQFHATWWDNPQLRSFNWLPPIDRGIQEIERIFPQYWRSFKQRMQPHLSPEAIRLGDSLRSSLREIRASLARAPQTFLHGDFQGNNLLFRNNGSAHELFVIDWQVCRRGRAMRDVAHFMGLTLDTEVRRTHEEALLGHYYQTLTASGVQNYSYEQALEDYKVSLLDLFYFLVVISLFLDFSENPELLNTVVDRVCAITLDHHSL